jgi:hypothetical protein
MKRTPKQITTDPRAFARYFLKILDKEKQLVPLIWNAAQLDFQAHRTGRDLILKARQLGFSTLVQGELFRRTITSTRTTITLAHDSESTQKLRRMADRFYRHCAFNDIRPARHYANARLSTYPEFDSTAIIATAGSLQVGRGDTYTDMHGSEVAFWPDAEAIVTGAMQGGSPDVILESTPNGAQGYFYERCMEALNGQGVWTLHFYPWWWDADYRLPLEDGERLEYTEEETRLAEQHQLDAAQIKWRRRKQDELRAKFLQEYPEDPYTCFLMSGGSYFGDISQVWTAPLNPAYDPTHRYKAHPGQNRQGASCPFAHQRIGVEGNPPPHRGDVRPLEPLDLHRWSRYAGDKSGLPRTRMRKALRLHAPADHRRKEQHRGSQYRITEGRRPGHNPIRNDQLQQSANHGGFTRGLARRPAPARHPGPTPRIIHLCVHPGLHRSLEAGRRRRRS